MFIYLIFNFLEVWPTYCLWHLVQLIKYMTLWESQHMVWVIGYCILVIELWIVDVIWIAWQQRQFGVLHLLTLDSFSANRLASILIKSKSWESNCELILVYFACTNNFCRVFPLLYISWGVSCVITKRFFKSALVRILSSHNSNNVVISFVVFLLLLRITPQRTILDEYITDKIPPKDYIITLYYITNKTFKVLSIIINQYSFAKHDLCRR